MKICDGSKQLYIEIYKEVSVRIEKDLKIRNKKKQGLEMIIWPYCLETDVRVREYIMESLILAQNERWRRVLSMQVERQGTAMYPRAADW